MFRRAALGRGLGQLSDKNITMMIRTTFLIFLFAVASAVNALAFQAKKAVAEKAVVVERLGQSLRSLADATIEYCQKNELKSVGVLKFGLFDSEGNVTTKTGTINSLLADRMEVALVLANDARRPVTLIGDASAVAAETENATHLSKAGRKLLMNAQYNAMWGDKELKADALVTAIGEISADFKSITLSLLIFDKTSEELRPLGGDKVIAVDANLLAETGASFSTRGAFDGGRLKGSGQTDTGLPPSDLPTESAAEIRAGKSAHPLADPQSPVTLQVLYDGVPVAYQFVDGKARIAEPSQGQRVELILTKDQTNRRYGVVVKVNGRNTLYQQQAPDPQCAKWVLSTPGLRKSIKGFQIRGANALEQFKVLSQNESKNREMDYGKDVGTISISVFPEGQPEKLVLDQEVRDAKLVEASLLPKKASSTFGALKAKLLSGANRGLIAEGIVTAGAVKTIKFKCSSTPIMSAVAEYYSP